MANTNPFLTTPKWRSGARTDTGPVRAVNEDAVLQTDGKSFWAVADGLGGHSIGDVASQLVVDGLRDVALKASLDECVDAIEDKLIAINDEIQNYSETHIGGKKMGATVVCLHILGNVGVCLWAGDSRLYRFRDNTLRQMTRDHSHVEELIKRGMLDRKQAATHPERNVITRAVGADSDLFVEVTVFGVAKGDTFLLCSDGLYGVVEPMELAKHLTLGNADNCAKMLIEKALASDANDNISAVVIKEGARH